MKSCLKSYHGSDFDGRKINCELTAGGGGGKSETRKAKLLEKNQRLKDERKRRVEHEEKEKKQKEKKAKEAGTGSNAGEMSNHRALAMDGAADGEENNDGIHPSRRSRIRT